MKTSVLKIISGTVFLFVLASCSAGPKGPWFWKVEKDGKTLNILGTFHIGVAFEELQCFKEISNSLDNSTLLFIEHDVSPESEFMQQLAKASNEIEIDTTGQSFQSLSEESRQFLKEKIESNIETLSYVSISFILGQVCLSSHSDLLKELKPTLSSLSGEKLDIQIQNRAQSKGIVQDSLDDPGYLPNLARSNAKKISAEEIEEMIRNYDTNCSRETIKESIENTINFLNAGIEKYKSGEDINIQKDIENFKKQGVADTLIKEYEKNLNQNLLKKRNEVWIKKLLSSHEKYQNIFVAAGLAHFTENFNVLDMLKKEGFSVKRLSAACKTE